MQANKRTYCWHLDLGALLEVLGKGLNEVFGWYILDGNTVVRVENSNLNLYTDQRKRVYLLPSYSFLLLV